MRYAWLILMLLLPPVVAAQTVVPAGTLLPLQLETGLNAAKLRPGEVVRARVMQNIPDTDIRRGDHVLGHVISADPAHVRLRFDTLVAHGERVPLHTNIRALASMLEVEEAYEPEGGADRALPPADWNTEQIGGDQVYRGGGPVTAGLTVVGEPTPNGVRGSLVANAPCRAVVAGNHNPQAFWLFSTNACGLYGIPGVTIRHAGRTTNSIELVSTSGRLNIRSGSGLLLRVQGS